MVGSSAIHINAVDFSPDGSRIVTVDDGNTAQVWDAGTGRQLLRKANVSVPGPPSETRPVGRSRAPSRRWDTRGREPQIATRLWPVDLCEGWKSRTTEPAPNLPCEPAVTPGERFPPQKWAAAVVGSRERQELIRQ